VAGAVAIRRALEPEGILPAAVQLSQLAQVGRQYS